MASALLKWETLDAEQLDDIMAGKEPREPKPPESGDGPKNNHPEATNAEDKPESHDVKTPENEEQTQAAPEGSASDADGESEKQVPTEDSVKKPRKRAVKKDTSV